MTLKLNVIDRDGEYNEIDVEEGATIRDAIEDSLSPDNYGICGGNCACGTCHIFVNPSDFDKIDEKEKDEIMTLESFSVETNQYSRLACQIEFKKEYENITVTIAPD